MIVFENRASYILYNFLLSTDCQKKIILPSNVCPIVLATVLKAKKPFSIVDISEKDLHLDTNKTKELLNKSIDSYDSILFVRTYGAMLSFNSFFKEVKKLNQDIIIIDDRCLTIPNFSPELENVDVELYSTGYSKYVDIGYGGYAFYRPEIKYVRNPLNFKPTDLVNLTHLFKESIASKVSFTYIDNDWLNAEIPTITINDYISLVKNKLPQIRLQKKKINSIYYKYLPKEIIISDEFNDWRFNILTSKKNLIIDKIFDSKLFASSHYAPLSFFIAGKNYNVSEKIHSKIINLFNDFRFDEKMAYKSSLIIKDILGDLR